MAAADADFGGLDELAARLAPGVVAEAVTEAREVARAQLVQLLAREITRAACGQAVVTAAAEPAAAEPAAAEPAAAEPEAAKTEAADGPRPEGAERGHPRALYAYGIVPAGTEVSDLPGLVEEARVDVVTRDQVSLVVSDIDPDLLRDLEEDLSETGPLAALARGHDQVLRELQDRGAVLPLRFGTVLPGAREAGEILGDPAAELPRALDALRGAREWGFRIDAPGRSESREHEVAQVPSGAGGTAGPGAGAAYLSARRDELREQERQREETARLIERAHRELLAHARDVARRPGRPDRAFDCAYLVDRAEEEEFLDAAERLGPSLENVGYTASVTGPWPPYSFVHLTLGGDGTPGGDGRTGEERG
ncbi:Gas vesicle synthesis protein GvpL/GvpF [Frankia sp. EI5c]|nr:Gas vesicle synthesis protein GvpL/GvpF [Frankia sp. EI5c]